MSKLIINADNDYMPKKRTTFSSGIAFIVKFFLISIFFFLVALIIDHFYYIERVYPGVKIDNYNIGGEKISEIKKHVDKDLAFLGEQKHIHFHDKDGKSLLSVSLEEVGIEPDWESFLEEAYMVGRKNLSSAITVGIPVKRFKLFLEGKIFNINLTFNEEKLNKIFDQLNNKVYVDAENASLGINNDGSLIFINEKPGVRLDYVKTKQNIIDETGSYLWNRDKNMIFRVEAVKVPVEANLTTNDLEGYRFDNIKASFTTNLGSSDENRRHNINLASQKLNNMFLMPDAIFSFNEVVGNADSAAGYLESTVIIDGDFATGVGGGICQVSTTLYNAVKIAKMEITERHLHSKPVSYVDPGDDATISYPYKDLKFKNTLSHPVIIGVVIKDNKITVNIHGK